MDRAEIFKDTYHVPAGFDTGGWYETAVTLAQPDKDEQRRLFMTAWPRGRYVDLFGAPTTDLPPVSPNLSKGRLAEVVWEALKANEGGDVSNATFALVRTMVDADLYPVIPSDVGHDRIVRANVTKLKAVNDAIHKLRVLPTPREKRQYATLYLAHPHWLGTAAQGKELYKRYYATIAAYQVDNMGAPQKGEDEEDSGGDEMDLF
jgi:hypothetical protein